MVLYVLYAKADLEGLSSLSILPGSDICISVRNTTHDQTRERIVVEASRLQEADVPDHEKHRHEEHSSHFALTWEGEKDRSTIRVIENNTTNGTEGDGTASPKKEKTTKKRNDDGIITRDITPRDEGQFVPILKLECDGLEPYAFHPMGKEFVVVANNGRKVEDVDLSSGEWSDYDLASGTSAVTNFETKFE